ncbi:MAG: sel1 repeat family protein [Cellvibrio sp.]|nr:sel1 repeat family protein [Cellvibrio sp.]
MKRPQRKNPSNSNKYCSALANYWSGSYAKTIKITREIINDDYPVSYMLLADALMRVEKPDKKELFQYWFKAAKSGHIESLHSIGKANIDGFGIQRDINYGIELHEKLAASGFAMSAFSLFTVYYHGKSVKKDIELANKWLIQAADLGDANSQHILAAHYMNGDSDGIERDLDKALVYASRAAQQGWPAAIGMVGYLLIVGKEDNLYRGYQLIKEAEKTRPEDSKKILRNLHCFDLSDSEKINICVYHKLFSHHKYQLYLTNDSEQPLFRLIDDTVENINIESKVGKLTGGCKATSGKSDNTPIELGRSCEFFLNGKPFGKRYSWKWKDLE